MTRTKKMNETFDLTSSSCISILISLNDPIKRKDKEMNDSQFFIDPDSDMRLNVTLAYNCYFRSPLDLIWS